MSSDGERETNEGECTVCLGPLNANCSALPCGHVADTECLIRWLGKGNERGCPVCRAPAGLHQMTRLFATPRAGDLASELRHLRGEIRRVSRRHECPTCKTPAYFFKDAKREPRAPASGSASSGETTTEVERLREETRRLRIACEEKNELAEELKRRAELKERLFQEVSRELKRTKRIGSKPWFARKPRLDDVI